MSGREGVDSRICINIFMLLLKPNFRVDEAHCDVTPGRPESTSEEESKGEQDTRVI